MVREAMQVILDIPAPLARPGQDPARGALEAWGLEAYRQRRLSEYQLRTLLGLPLPLGPARAVQRAKD